MTPIRIRPRSSIADPELARAAVVDLPPRPERQRVRAVRGALDALVSWRRAGDLEPERVIVLTLVPVAARRR